jgi:serine phosphatase RsbU (regulator of sigma subunit)
MIYRFQTRLAVSVSLVIGLTVLGMTVLIVLFAANLALRQNREKAVLLHRLLQNSIENVTEIPAGTRGRPPREFDPESNLTPDNSPLIFALPPETIDENESSARRIRRFGIGGRGDLRVIVPGQRPFPRRSDLLVQGIASCFVVDTDIERILVVQTDGRIAATANMDGDTSDPPATEIALQCQEYLQSEPATYQINTFGTHVSVMTPLKSQGNDPPRALYVQFRKASVLNLLGFRLFYPILLGIGMISIGILVSIRLSRRLSHPITALASKVREFGGGGNLSHRIKLETDDELQALGEAFNQMADSVQAYTLKLEHETKRRESLESELRIAADLQRSLLPEKPPQIPGLDLAGWSQPAAQVGGDFFDYLDFGQGRVGVMIGDATGKGLPAALLTNECWSMLAAFSQSATSPADLLFKTNNALCKRLDDSGQFVTLFLMMIDVSRGTLRYSVAGHNPPFLVGSDPSRDRLLSSREGYPLGLFPDCKFEDIELALHPSDTILLYSDGLTEALGRSNGRYGDERLRSALNGSHAKSLPDLIHSIRSDLNTHTEGAVAMDDVTIVGARFTNSGLLPHAEQ